jgi:pilus assembly protein FimV
MARDTQGSPADEKKLEQYGVWVKVKPRDVTTAPILEESFGLSDLESPRAPTRSVKAAGESALTAEEEKLLDELETELEPDAGAEGIAVPEEEPLLDDAELPEFESAAGRMGSSDLESRDDELPELEEDLEPAPRAAPKAGGQAAGRGRLSEVEVTLSDAAEDHFDDLAALESELASVATKTADASTSSAEILARIEDELRSIRSDLNQLRHDLSGLRKTAAEGGGEGPSAQAGSQSGFFDEDEDEAIALTGDELDNILNTAEITEETAEAPGAGVDMDLMGGMEALESGDVLSFDTPAAEAVEMPASSDDLELVEDAEPEDDTLVLTDDDLLPTAGVPGGTSAAVDDDLPADLVLEELTSDDDGHAADAGKDSSEMPEIDLEEIPEMESEPEIAPAPRMDSAMDDQGNETIDLETLDLGEEPMVINAEPEQGQEVEDLQDAEEVLELDEEPSTKATGKTGAQQPDEVDLEALAAEAEELEDDVPAAPVVEDLEIGELEALADEADGIVTPQKEIEIDFEGDLAEEVEALTGPAEAASDSEDVPEAEEISEPTGPAGDSAGEVPDNLKDELRTVLTYMDHLLEALPDEKIQEFASSEYFVRYKKLFEDLGLGE